MREQGAEAGAGAAGGASAGAGAETGAEAGSAGAGAAGGAGAGAEARAPDPERFLSGSSGDPGRGLVLRARRIADRLLDAHVARAAGPRLDELAAAAPEREVLVLSVYRGEGGLLPAALAELRGTRHAVRFALGSMGTAAEQLATATAATGMSGGKFENLDALLGTAGDRADWTLVVDDDVVLPTRFLDRLLGLAEHHDLALAQPAQSLASHAAWPVTRRRRGSLLRVSRFVEIGPVTLFRRDALDALTPFPPLKFGWGLDLHWAAVAEERGWQLGIADALAVRHEQARVAGTYSSREAIEEAREFLAGRPFLDSAAVQETLRVHPLR
ncbi:MAG TPA: glycosyltransferase [Thermoleophilaceae bacterium]